ncbi:MAG TPA: hypothetical protein PLA74_05885 [Syntrophales bacterium]|nr:hypothetical protein [Syntrophales bacterium]
MGPTSQKFIENGIHTFHDACRWVTNLPYGYNSNKTDPYIIFMEGKGTCSTKHAAIGLLAQEIGLPISKFLGLYRLTDEIITGIGEILKPHGLEYIPQIHCFLGFKTTFVDLTEGNCTGKNKPLENFDLIVRVKPILSESEEEDLYKTGLDFYRQDSETLRTHTKEDLIEILKECNRKHEIICSLL